MSRRQRHLQCFDGLAPVSDIKKCIKHGHPVLILMRGPPGCGKSHLAEELRAYRTVDDDDTRQPVILSTDRFFYTPKGRYAFDHTRLDDFHKKNQQEARAALEENRSPVIIDNTNMQLAHMKPYITAAIKSFYEIYVVDPATAWRHDARQLAEKNVHFVDELRIGEMLASFEPIPRFADLLKPVEFVISRVALSDDDDDEDGEKEKAGTTSPKSLVASPSSTTTAIGSSESPSTVAGPAPTTATTSPPSLLPLPPGLFTTPPPQQPQPTAIFSMAHETLVSVRQRDVGCQATPAIGLLLEMKGEEPAPIAELCCTAGEERVAQRRRCGAVVDAATDAACAAPTLVTTFTAAFPKVPEGDVEQFAPEFRLGEYTDLLLTMGYAMDYAAPIPWQPEGAERNSRTRKGRQKEVGLEAFMESAAPHTSPKKPAPARTPKKARSGRGEGCGVTPSAEQHAYAPPTASLSSAVTTAAAASSSSSSSGHTFNPAAAEFYLEEKVEPLAAAFTDDDELIALDVKQPIKNILELFFGHASRQPDVHLPMWLLRLLHRCARGDRLTKAAVYHEEFPAIDLAALHDEAAMHAQQMRNDEEIARRMHAEEREKRERARSSSPTDTFTAAQISGVRLLRAKFPLADPDSVAGIFEMMNFDTVRTVHELETQFGQSAPGPAHLAPHTSMAPVATSSASISRSSSCANYAAASAAGARVAQQQQPSSSSSFVSSSRASLPTLAGNGRITDVGRMAAANGAPMTQDEVRVQFCALHEKREEKQKLLDEALRKAQSAVGAARGYYGQEIRIAKAARIQVEAEIAELALWWNANLNSDVLDLHWMLADQAMGLLREKIEAVKEAVKRGSGPKRLTVITGSGNNSLGGQGEIKKRVLSMAKSQGYKYHHNNDGCIIFNF